ncbi:MAG: hypothetical protein R2744_10605 [Bacteroidales bacterium]
MKEFNSNSFREEGHKLIDMLADYLDATGNGTGYPVLPVSDPGPAGRIF